MLAKMLQAQTDDQQPMPIIGWEQVLVFLVEPLDFGLRKTMEVKKAHFHYSNNYSFRYSNTSYKPPMV